MSPIQENCKRHFPPTIAFKEIKIITSKIHQRAQRCLLIQSSMKVFCVDPLRPKGKFSKESQYLKIIESSLVTTAKINHKLNKRIMSNNN